MYPISVNASQKLCLNLLSIQARRWLEVYWSKGVPGPGFLLYKIVNTKSYVYEDSFKHASPVSETLKIQYISYPSITNMGSTTYQTKQITNILKFYLNVLFFNF